MGMGNGTAQGGIHVGLGSSSFKQEYSTDTNTYAGGSLSSSGTVTILAGSKNTAKGNIHATGETMQGKDVTLAASNNIILDAGKNTQTETNNYSSKGASIGVTVGIGGINNVDASFSKEKDQGTTEKVVHTGTTIMASGTLTTISGKDTNIIGSQVGGDTVTINAGGNLNIESLQDTETYRGHSSSSGASISSDVSSTGLLHNTSSSASFSKGSMNSDYASVTNQAGIYAGNGGFQINVADNTHLTGGIIDSTASADTNHLTTGTLTMDDIQNKADYDVKNVGVSYTHYGNIKDKYDNYNKTGFTPNLSAGAKKDASSTTLSAIGQGSITTTKQQLDLSKINRDTRHALNELGTIFDKKKIEERQELAQLFAKNANELLHSFDKDGKFDKVLAHGIVAEITSQIAGNKAGSGFLAGAVNEALIHRIEQLANGDPAKMQWISAALGATVNAAVGGTVATGAATAQYGTKWNNLSKTRQEQINLIMKNEILTGKMSGDNVVQFFEGLVAESKAEDKRQAAEDKANGKLTPNQSNAETSTTDTIIVYGEYPVINGTLLDQIAQQQGVQFTYDEETPPTKNLEEFISKLQQSKKTTDGYGGADVGKSFISNTLSTKANMLPDILTQEGYGGAPLKTVGKAGGFIGISLTLNSIYSDYQQYNGVDFVVAAGSDVIPLILGAGGGIAGTYFGPTGTVSGSIVGGMAGDYVQYLIRDTYFNKMDPANENKEGKGKRKNEK